MHRIGGLTRIRWLGKRSAKLGANTGSAIRDVRMLAAKSSDVPGRSIAARMELRL
jgi:hypothetical protein